jgi:hypothetical protein
MVLSSLFTLSLRTMNFYSVTKVIADLPELSAALDYDGLITYIDLVRLLKPDLTRFVVSENGPPKHLPVAFHDFLKLSLGLEDETAKLAWATLRLFAWNFDHQAEDPRKTGRVRLKYMRLFLEHGSSRGIGTS